MELGAQPTVNTGLTFPAVTVLSVSISFNLVSKSGVCSTYAKASWIIFVTA